MQEIFALLIDFELAFDSDPHSMLCSRLGQLGGTSRMIQVFVNIYTVVNPATN